VTQACLELIRGVALLGVAGIGPTEVVLAVVLLAVGGYFALTIPASEHSSHEGKRVQASANTPRSAVPEVSGRQPSVSLARKADGQPSGSYLQWPTVAFWGLVILGLIGASAGSGGSPEGFIAALVLNPILWAAIYVFWKIGNIRCPHCRKSFPIGDAAKYPVGSAITCRNCGNDFAKPAG
jgi:hypothetical protein